MKKKIILYCDPSWCIHSFLLHVTFIPRRPEYKMIPTAFIFLPTILYDNCCADYIYSNNEKIIFSMMPDSMCFVSKCINSTERMMVILCNILCELYKFYLRGCLKSIIYLTFLCNIILY